MCGLRKIIIYVRIKLDLLMHAHKRAGLTNLRY